MMAPLLEKTVRCIRDVYSGAIGFHAHDNMGLAFANTLKAIDLGITFIDCTVTGMGRGAGNLRTEQLLLYLYHRLGYRHLDPTTLHETIATFFMPLRAQHEWGWDYSYMLSALENVHPTYCQRLRAAKRYTTQQVSQVLGSLPSSERARFSEAVLLETINRVLEAPVEQEDSSSAPPCYRPVDADSFLVIATGDSKRCFEEEICEFIRQHQPVVFECNPQGTQFASVAERYYGVILSLVRLKELMNGKQYVGRPIVVGVNTVPSQYLESRSFLRAPCKVSEKLSICGDEILLPASQVGMFAIAVAMLSSPNTIYLAGYDGYSDEACREHQEMLSFWRDLDCLGRIVSLTPTRYPIEVQPIYGLLR